MKYVYVVLLALSFVCGAVISHRLQPGPVVREVPVTVTKTQTVTKEIEKFPNGKVVERVVTQTRDKIKASPQPPKPEYRTGILMPVGSARLPTVSASKRLFGGVWMDAQYDLRHKEVTLGVSYEF